MKHIMDFGILKFYFNENEYSGWLRDARESGVEIKFKDGDRPLQFPSLVVASTTFVDNNATEADIYFAYPDDITEAGGPESDTDRQLLNSESDFAKWRQAMADDDVLVSTVDVDAPLRYPCLMLSHERVSNAGNAVAEVLFIYPEDFLRDSEGE